MPTSLPSEGFEVGPVLVTGAAGFVGSHLVRALRARGRDVIAYDLASALPAHAIDDMGEGSGGVVHLHSDVTDPGQLVEALVTKGVTDMVHTAALLAEPESLARPRQFLRVNAEAVWQLCDIVRHLDKVRRVITVSTRSVYGAYRPEEGPLTEDFLPRPVGFYGGSKAAADIAVALYRERLGLDVVAARITGVYGPGQVYRSPFGDMIEAAVRGTPYLRERGGDYPYELNYVKDVVRGMLALLDAPELAHPLYNVGNGKSYPLAEAASVVRRVVPGALIEIGSGLPEGVAPRASLSVDRLRSETGFVSAWTLEEGVRETVQFLRDGTYGSEVRAD